MKENLLIQREILNSIEASEHSLLFEQFYEHAIGGFEKCITPDRSPEQAYNIRLLGEKGLVRIDRTAGDEPWLMEAGPEPIYAETYLRLSPEGHSFLSSQTFKARCLKIISLIGKGLTLSSGQIAISIITAAATVLVLRYFGLGN